MLTPEQKAKLNWRCRRGMLELDLFLSRFLHEQGDNLTPSQVQCFEALLEAAEPDLYVWLLGQACPVDKGWQELVNLMRS